ncbi:MAG: NifU family protein [Candidatus Dasytiphilus stammeri]
MKIHISNQAQEHFTRLLSSQEVGTQIRIFIINPGTYHAECRIAYCQEDNRSLNDIKLNFESFSIYIDEISAPWLVNAEIDFTVNELGTSELTLKVPNITKSNFLAKDKNASLIKRVEHFLHTRINPQLAVHGGAVTIKAITKDGYAILNFSGGCNGCSMVNVTVKEHIEKELLYYFTEIKGVRDITEHHRSINSYY